MKSTLLPYAVETEPQVETLFAQAVHRFVSDRSHDAAQLRRQAWDRCVALRATQPSNSGAVKTRAVGR
jgi:hypothetical protein